MDSTQTDQNASSNAKSLERVPGKSLFPVARVQKIVKADKELAIVAREAIFLLSMATEEFIIRLSQASRSQAARERRTTVQKKDILTSVRRGEEYYFLQEIMETDFSRLKKSKGGKSGQDEADGTIQGAFEKMKEGKDGEADQEASEDDDVVEEDEEEEETQMDVEPSEQATQPPDSPPPASEPMEDDPDLI